MFGRHTEFKSFNGRTNTLATIDHQHLSNLFYFEKYTWPRVGTDPRQEIIALIQEELDERFNGQLLPYRPHIRFEQELNVLRTAGYLMEDGRIVVNGKQIGEVLTIENHMK